MFERRYFIVAQNFHGTTLLSKLLNDHPKVVSLGDTYPSNGLDQVCGCRAPVSRCRFWSAVTRDVDADRHRDCPHLLPHYPRIVGGRIDRVLYNILRPGVLSRLVPGMSLDTFARSFEAFEASIHRRGERPEATVFVDGLKSISRVYALIAAGVRVDGVIHLHRDPGDYIKSTMKKVGNSWRVFLPRMIEYRMFHRLARRTEAWVPYCSVTYEGLADDPDATLNALFRFLSVTPMPVAELVSRKSTEPWHFMGNASLFGFDGRIRRSQHKLSTSERRLVRLLGGHYSWEKIHLASRP